jgi:tRNA threonylcarbamoyl adenosine modification protein YeaZ
MDTATPAVTVALHDGDQPLAQSVTVDTHRHAEVLAPAIAKVIAEAGLSPGDLTGVAVGVGPGPYTGLRVGLVTAKVLAAALGIPVYGVCTLDVIAADVEGEQDFLVATDARRRELYWARYDQAGRQAGPAVSAPGDIPADGLPVAGEGPLIYTEFLPRSTGPAYPAAATLCRLVAQALARGETPPGPGTGPGGAEPSTGATATGTDGGGPGTDAMKTGPDATGTGTDGAGTGTDRPGSGPVGPGTAGAPVRAARSVLVAPEPLYLRRPDAREPGRPKRVTP